MTLNTPYLSQNNRLLRNKMLNLFQLQLAGAVRGSPRSHLIFDPSKMMRQSTINEKRGIESQ